jgi:hypothetical protein
MAKTQTSSGKLRSEYVVAVIGLLGVILTGVLSNWDKLTKNVVSSEYSGYRPTGDFETEMRYFLDVNGTRAQVQQLNDQLLGAMQEQIKKEDPDDQEEAANMFGIIKKNGMSVDETIDMMLPIWKKYLTIDQIQQLNKFYSTPDMQNMVRVQPAIIKETMPLLVAKMQEHQKKMMEEFEAAESDAQKNEEQP